MEGTTMEPEIRPPLPTEPPVPAVPAAPHTTDAPTDEETYRGLLWIFIGSQGLRTGWSVLIFVELTLVLMAVVGTAATELFYPLFHAAPTSLSPVAALIMETAQLLPFLASFALMLLIEGRHIQDYNLADTRRLWHFLGGLLAGFAALSALVGALAWGGWLHFSPATLSGAQTLRYAAVWGLVFLMTGFYEEGSFRCYLQYTLTRGINFYWALGTVAFFCIDLAVKAWLNLDLVAIFTLGALRTAVGGAMGVYVVALLGIVPCLILHVRKTPGSTFWQAAWVTSTVFGFLHTTNSGEDWIGIFSTAAIGFIFCISIRVTGSAWWAIGCHAAWDWAETYFYGTADSGIVSEGHFLTTNPAGNVLWSGGTDGPEGSLLILGVLLLLLMILLLIHGREKAGQKPVTAVAKNA
jgi:hypothetical protein